MAQASARELKKRRLGALAGLKHVSAEALAAILQHVAEDHQGFTLVSYGGRFGRNVPSQSIHVAALVCIDGFWGASPLCTGRSPSFGCLAAALSRASQFSISLDEVRSGRGPEFQRMPSLDFEAGDMCNKPFVGDDPPTHRKQEPESLPASSAWSINRYLAESLDEVKHTIQLPLADGRDFSWVVCRADKLLQHFVAATGSFKQVLREALEAPPPFDRFARGLGNDL